MNRTLAPHAIAAMIWGGISALFALIPLFSIFGLVFGIIGMSYSVKGLKLYALDSQNYSCGGLLKAAKICSIAGMSVGLLLTIITILVAVIISLNY